MRKIYLLCSLFLMAMVCSVALRAQITVTATAATPGPTAYTTLFNAITAINAGTHQGIILITVNANTIETSTSSLNASGTGAASYTRLIIKPAPATTPVITGNLANALLKLNGADNVLIDGSNTVGGTTRDLTISNTNTGTSTVIWISSVGAAGATDNKIANCIIRGDLPTTTVAGIATGDNVALGNQATGPNSRDTVENNQFSNTQNALYVYGSTGFDQGWVVTKNVMTTHGFRGMILLNTNSFTISENVVSGVTSPSTFLSGIQVGGGGGGSIYRNNISNINNTGASAGCNGLMLLARSGPLAIINVYNNFISNVWSTTGNAFGATWSDNGHGIYVGPDPTSATNATYNIYYNTVRMVTPQTSGRESTPINIGASMSASSVNLKDNIFDNEQTAGATFIPAIYCSSPSTVFQSIDNNDYASSAATPLLGYIGATSCNTLAQVQTNFGSNLNSVSITPVFAAAIPDLHLALTGINFGLWVGAAITTPPITVDIDLANRSPSNTTVGAHELVTDTIIYTPLVANTCSTGDVTLNPVTVRAGGPGIPLVGAFIPRIYYRKNAGPWFSAAGTFLTGNANFSTWSFVISATTMGGVIGSDVISYYVIAQDAAAAPVVFASPGAGLVASDVVTVTTPPSTPNTYTVQAISLTGLTTTGSICFGAGGNVNYPFAGAPGSPSLYTTSWSPTTGPANVSVASGFGPSPFSVIVPSTSPVGTYTGTLTLTNATGCSKTYTLTLTVNPPPPAITGNLQLCVATASPLLNAVGGGTWVSTTTSVATIGSLSGIAVGTGAGTSVITYTAPTGCYTTTVVSVSAPPAAIGGGTTPFCQTTTITLTNSISGGVWGSLNTGVAIVSSTGDVTGVSGGTAVITYATPGCNAVTKTVTVNPLPSIISGSLSVCQGFTSTLSNSTGGGLWHSSDTAKARIDSVTGVLVGVAPGTALISYSALGCHRVVTATVNANPAPVSGAAYVCQGLSTTMTNATSGGTWISQFPGVASVTNTTGIVTGVAAGSASTISYVVTSTGCYATKQVTVTAPPSAISGPNVFCSNSSITLLNYTPGGTWSSQNTAIATVGPTSPVHGRVDGVTNGTTIISYTTLACNPVTYQVTLMPSPASITGVTNVCGGASTTLANAVGGGVWTSSNPSVNVTPAGVVTGLTTGITVTISYTLSNGCYTVAPIVVANPPGPIYGPDSLCQTGTGLFTNDTTDGIWTSSNGAIASIVALTGSLTAVTPGTVTISYTRVSGCRTTKQFTVRNPLSASITFTKTPDTTVLCAGTPLTFVAHPVNGGASPTIEWWKFGAAFTPTFVSADGDSMIYTPAHGDYITVRLHGDTAICSLPDPAVYSEFMNVIPTATPSVSIVSSVPVVTYLGQVVTFTSSATSTGSPVTYQWYVNGLPQAGATGTTFSLAIYSPTSVQCKIVGHPLCPTDTNAASNSITIGTKFVGVQQLSISKTELSVVPNPNTGLFSLKGASEEKELAVEITDVLGQVVYRTTVSPVNGVINESVGLDKNLAAGSYLIRVHSDVTNEVLHFVLSK